MNLIDTHSHLYEPEFDADREEALARAFDAGVGLLLLPAIDAASDERLFALCRRHPDRCLPMMGLHPTSVNDNPRWREELARVARCLDNPPEGVPPFCAVGEIGLDYYWDDRFAAEQIEAFTAQCRLAAARNLPVAIHTRAAWNDMRRIVGEEAEAARARGERLRGVFHAFSEDADTYRALRGAGDFLFGIGGVVTGDRLPLPDARAAPGRAQRIGLRAPGLREDRPDQGPRPRRGRRRHDSQRRADVRALGRKHLRPRRRYGAGERARRHPRLRHAARNGSRTDRYATTMKRVRITVVRKVCHRDLIARYENPIEHACDLSEGQVFVSEGWQKPEGLCESAWQTLSPFVMALAHGATGLYDGWMKNPASAMISCNDGFRPVSFLIETLD